jgi:acetoacetate decarboxylase
MKIDAVRKTAFAMPLTNPAYPRGPYRFYDSVGSHFGVTI